MILSSFYWGYVLTHIPAGVLAEQFGGKYPLALGILFSSICTMLVPLVTTVSNGNWIWVTILRVFVGMGQVHFT